MMKRETMLEVQNLAQKIQKDIVAVIIEMDRSRSPEFTFWGTKASGQLRRRSMDLTRKLAELRAGK